MEVYESLAKLLDYCIIPSSNLVDHYPFNLFLSTIFSNSTDFYFSDVSPVLYNPIRLYTKIVYSS